MRVQVRGKGIEIMHSVRARAERSLQFALGRYGERIELVTVRLVDVNGPRGGADKRCLLDVKLYPTGRLLIEEVADDAGTALDRAADRAQQAVGRQLQRTRRRNLQTN